MEKSKTKKTDYKQYLPECISWRKDSKEWLLMGGLALRCSTIRRDVNMLRYERDFGKQNIY